jgi:class 3 adenylate cyclase
LKNIFIEKLQICGGIRMERTNQDLESSSTDNYSINYSGTQRNYCVGIVSLTESKTPMSFQTKAKRSQIFLNSVAKILTRFGGVVIKNKADMILYYFPQSSKINRRYGFMSCLESCLTLVADQDAISLTSEESGLPPINYRISVDFGKVAVMYSNFSDTPDLLGPTVNICSKINSLAPVNGVVLGGDLHQVVKNFGDYKYHKLGQHSVGLKQPYPVLLLDCSSIPN